MSKLTQKDSLEKKMVSFLFLIFGMVYQCALLLEFISLVDLLTVVHHYMTFQITLAQSQSVLDYEMHSWL